MYYMLILHLLQINTIYTAYSLHILIVCFLNKILEIFVTSFFFVSKPVISEK